MAVRLLVLVALCALACGEEDFYAILGVPRDATARVIKKEYHRLARVWHPDKHPDDAKAEAKFKKMTRAYEVLSDPQKRRQYDQFGEAGLNEGGGGGGGGGHHHGFHFGGGGGGGNTFEMNIDPEMFHSFFGGGGGRGGGFGGFGGFGGGGMGGGFHEEEPPPRRERVCFYNKVCTARGCKQVRECKS